MLESSERIEAKMASTNISAEHITKVYQARKKQTVAMQDCSIQILENEFVCIVGASGCGKSTLLRMLAGLDFPTEGTITVNDKPVTGPGVDRGMVFQGYTLFPWLTVEQNLRYGLKLKKMPKPQQDEIVDKYLKIIGLSNFRNAYPHQLSGGMKQRVAIARMLANSPEFLLMDEPFGALDALTRDHLNEELLKIWQKTKKTVIFVTHSIEEATFLSDRVLVMSARPGRVKEMVEIDLPRPRGEATRNDPKFTEYNKYLRGIIG